MSKLDQIYHHLDLIIGTRNNICESDRSYSRTPQDMDGTLTLIFAKSETPKDITTKISAFLQLRKKRILTKFEGCGSKNGPATPISILNCSRAWQSFKVSYALQIWYKAGTY